MHHPIRLSKAFDHTVPRQPLLTKLRYYGKFMVVLIIGSKPHLFVALSVLCQMANHQVSFQFCLGYHKVQYLVPLNINYITNKINSPFCLFADDCLLYRVINGLEDTNMLQEELNRLPKQANIWQLKFNVRKYTVIRYA